MAIKLLIECSVFVVVIVPDHVVQIAAGVVARTDIYDACGG